LIQQTNAFVAVKNKRMKKVVYVLATVLTLGFAIVSCDKPEPDVVIVHTTTPEIASAGTYSGLWTRTIAGTTDTLRAQGTILMEVDTCYISKLTFKCDSLSLNATVSANISFADKGFIYYNNSATNEMATPFTGRIDADSVNTTGFELKVRVGRKFQYCTFRFNGVKGGE
jgi:hypothetical protein